MLSECDYCWEKLLPEMSNWYELCITIREIATFVSYITYGGPLRVGSDFL